MDYQGRMRAAGKVGNAQAHVAADVGRCGLLVLLIPVGRWWRPTSSGIPSLLISMGTWVLFLGLLFHVMVGEAVPPTPRFWGLRGLVQGQKHGRVVVGDASILVGTILWPITSHAGKYGESYVELLTMHEPWAGHRTS